MPKLIAALRAKLINVDFPVVNCGSRLEQDLEDLKILLLCSLKETE